LWVGKTAVPSCNKTALLTRDVIKKKKKKERKKERMWTDNL
jgi:hypothetical protein